MAAVFKVRQVSLYRFFGRPADQTRFPHSSFKTVSDSFNLNSFVDFFSSFRLTALLKVNPLSTVT